MRRCKDCTWWRPNPRFENGVGVCTHHTAHIYSTGIPYGELEGKERSYSWFGSFFADIGEFMPGPDYSCPHWEAREDNE